ncbi:MAG: mechanosensitive ion channel family protein [Thermoplasmata archaeon]
MKLGSILLATLFLASLMSAFIPTASATNGDLHIFPPTITDMETEMDTSAVYRWGIYNNGTHPHTLLVDIRGGDISWTASLSDEDSYILIGPGEFVRIELTVTAPRTRDYPVSSNSLSATVRDLVTQELWVEDMGSVTTAISGGAYVPPTQVLGWFDDPLGNYIPALDNEWGVFVTTVLIWLIIGTAIYFILDPIVKQFTKRTKTNLDDEILTIIKGPVFWLILAYGVVSSLGVLDFPWVFINAMNLLFSSLAIILLGWVVFKVFKDVLLFWGKKYSEKTETTMDDVMLPLFENLGMVVIVVVAVILVLNLLGVDVTMLVAGMGVMGLVIAFAAQDTLGNFISGMFLLTDRPFKVGDLVLMENGDYCRVEKIGMRSTKLYNTFAHDMIILPNSKIANERVINLTEPDSKIKFNVVIGVDYSTDIPKAKGIIQDVVDKHPDIVHEDGRKPIVRLVDFGDHALMLKIFAWVHNLDNQWRVAAEIREEVLLRFRDQGIGIPFPQMVVHFPDGGDADRKSD